MLYILQNSEKFAYADDIAIVVSKESKINGIETMP